MVEISLLISCAYMSVIKKNAYLYGIMYGLQVPSEVYSIL